jgi:RNA polymerase sigma-70 factor (ECF subfamily)
MERGDDERIRALLAGETSSFAEVRRWVRAAASGYRDVAETEDLEQDTLAALVVALREGRFRGEASLQTYVRRQVHYTCIDRLRAAKARPTLPIEGLELPSPEPSSLGRLVDEERVATALRVLGQLPADCLDLWRGILAGKSYTVLSQERGVSEGTLRVRALRCRRRALETRAALGSSSNEARQPPTMVPGREP